jgi:tetratricopeptide (TPR) repeat protein
MHQRMKAEHRKELQTNFLADRMGRLLEGMKAGPKSSTSMVAWVLVILTIGTIAVWYAAGMYSNRSPLWVRFEQQSAQHNPEALASLANLNPGTLPARAARIQEARILLQEGLASLYSNQRDSAVKQVKEARKLFDNLSQECVDDPVLAPQALMGAAKAEEALVGIPANNDPAEGEGHLDSALEYYQKLTKKYPKSFLAKTAQERIDQLTGDKNRPEAEKFYQEMRKLVAENQKK